MTGIPEAVVADLAAALDDHRLVASPWTPRDAAEWALAHLAGAGWAVVPDTTTAPEETR